MAEVYVTLGEAAELERVKYNTMVKRVLRKQESFVTKTEKSENGGKDVVLVAVSSLSKQARNAWKEREKLKSFTEEFPDKKEDEQKPEVPWYVNTDVDWYIENYKERYYKAVELGNVVRKFLQYDEGDRTKYAEEFAQKYLGKGQRTLYRYTKAYLEASAWADKLEKEDGAGREFFKVLCLCRKPKETGCFSIQWYKEGGILNGATIFGAMGGNLLGGGEAGAEAVLPLSELWKQMTEIVKGVVKGENEESGDTVQQTGANITSALTSKAASVRKEKESKTTTTKETYTSERWGKEGGTTIHQISFTVDISKIKDLPLLYKLIDELKDAQNRTDSPTPATT